MKRKQNWFSLFLSTSLRCSSCCQKQKTKLFQRWIMELLLSFGRNHFAKLARFDLSNLVLFFFLQKQVNKYNLKKIIKQMQSARTCVDLHLLVTTTATTRPRVRSVQYGTLYGWSKRLISERSPALHRPRMREQEKENKYGNGIDGKYKRMVLHFCCVFWYTRLWWWIVM